MNPSETRVQNFLDAAKILIDFMIDRKVHSYQEALARVRDYIHKREFEKGFAAWEDISKGNMGGLFDLYVCAENWHRVVDDIDHIRFEILLVQFIDCLENLKEFVDQGIEKPLMDLSESAFEAQLKNLCGRKKRKYIFNPLFKQV